MENREKINATNIEKKTEIQDRKLNEKKKETFDKKMRPKQRQKQQQPGLSRRAKACDF